MEPEPNQQSVKSLVAEVIGTDDAIAMDDYVFGPRRTASKVNVTRNTAERIEGIVEQCAWTPETVNTLVCRFLDMQGIELQDRLMRYLIDCVGCEDTSPNGA